MKKIVSLLFLLGISLNLLAQQSVNSAPVEMADRFRADGKIYVVVVVLLVVLVGILLYLIRLDSKISRVEKEFKQ